MSFRYRISCITVSSRTLKGYHGDVIITIALILNADDHPIVESSDSPAMEYLILSPGGIFWKNFFTSVFLENVFFKIVFLKSVFFKSLTTLTPLIPQFSRVYNVGTSPNFPKCIFYKYIFLKCISSKCIFQLPPDVDSSDSPVQWSICCYHLAAALGTADTFFQPT